MKRILLLVLFSFVVCFQTFAAPQTVPKYLDDVSVLVSAENSNGSGFLFSRKDSKGDYVSFVWTAAHVIEGSRYLIDVNVGMGSTNKYKIPVFKDVSVVKSIKENGREVGYLEMRAEVIRYSSADNEDLCLLRIRKLNFSKSSVKFFKDVPEVGAKLYSVASIHGLDGINSFTTGVISQTGRVTDKKIFDQETCAAMPGSSGGGVFLENGLCVGMLIQQGDTTVNFIAPSRRIIEWAKRAKIEWAVDQNASLPSDEYFSNLIAEDSSEIINRDTKPKEPDFKIIQIPLLPVK